MPFLILSHVLRRLPCSHVFCRSCLKAHLDAQLESHLDVEHDYKDRTHRYVPKHNTPPQERASDAVNFTCPKCKAAVLFTPMIPPFHVKAATMWATYCGEYIAVERDERSMAMFWEGLHPHIYGHI